MPRTKIICTLGPASSSSTVIRQLAHAGMDVVRLNFSHGTHEEHARRIRTVRDFNRRYRRRIRILQDLEGHRIRTGLLKDRQPLPLRKRQRLTVTNNGAPGDAAGISIDYRGPLTDIPAGSRIYIDDGNIALVVTRSGKRQLHAEVADPGVLKEHKGVNIPGAPLRFGALSDKDRADLLFGIEHGVDFIAQSFVRDKKDMLAVRSFLAGRLPEAKIIAKIEDYEGIRNLEGILDVADGIMIARGDMGISLPIFEVPLVQKHIIRRCRERKRFSITATQMLESMVHSLIPTRAEVSDVANSIIDGTDYVMLSAESAVGEYPVATVTLMDEIIIFTEKYADFAKPLPLLPVGPAHPPFLTGDR